LTCLGLVIEYFYRLVESLWFSCC